MSIIFTHLRGWRRPGGIAAALLLSLVTLSAQAPAPQAPAAKGSSKGFIWQFERNGRVGWLVGSLHLATADFYPLPETMTRAFARADTLIEEVDMKEASDPGFAAMVLSRAMYPKGTTLASQLTPETNTVLNDWLMRSGLAGLPVQQMKPWMVSMTLQTLALQKLGLNPEFGIDKHFQDASASMGKRFIALETAADQIAYLDGLSPRTQDRMLRESIESIDTEMTEIKALTSAWRAGDAATVERIALSGMNDAPDIYQTLLVDRNRRWIPKIEACVQTRLCFVVVGAAHLVGPEGLIEMMTAKGFTLRQQ